MRFLRIQREDLPGYLAFRDDQRSDGFRPKAAHGFEAMPAVGSPETAAPWRENCDDRIEKTPCLIDDVGQPFVVSIGEIALKRRGLDLIDRQDAQQHRMTGERLLVRSDNAAAGLGDRFCSLRGSSCRLL